jgi:hypothetical protein
VDNNLKRKEIHVEKGYKPIEPQEEYEDSRWFSNYSWQGEQPLEEVIEHGRD